MKNFSIVRIDQLNYLVSDLDRNCVMILEKVQYLDQRVNELNNMVSLLLKAKNAYIADLNAEIVQERSGVDLGALFADD